MNFVERLAAALEAFDETLGIANRVKDHGYYERYAEEVAAHLETTADDRPVGELRQHNLMAADR